jgi:hypothetical protein
VFLTSAAPARAVGLAGGWDRVGQGQPMAGSGEGGQGGQPSQRRTDRPSPGPALGCMQDDPPAAARDAGWPGDQRLPQRFRGREAVDALAGQQRPPAEVVRQDDQGQPGRVGREPSRRQMR